MLLETKCSPIARSSNDFREENAKHKCLHCASERAYGSKDIVLKWARARILSRITALTVYFRKAFKFS
ncbi:hypothetical protein Leryth_003111 [Lithospermum erythrorhizon]|nr:hypothetical protein Leryth_003111 [Lithospermum erythrorhizon]